MSTQVIRLKVVRLKVEQPNPPEPKPRPFHHRDTEKYREQQDIFSS
jgi:hypothetical protein